MSTSIPFFENLEQKEHFIANWQWLKEHIGSITKVQLYPFVII